MTTWSENALSPFGSARVALAAELGRADAALDDEVRLRAVAHRLPVSDDRDAVVYLAWELTRRARGLTPREAHALTLVVVACLAEVRRGSTFLPLADLPAHLAALGARDEESELARRLLAGDPRVEAVLGTGGQRRPLLRVGDDLYVERLFFFEERLVASLAARARGTHPCSEVMAAAALEDSHLSDEQRAAVVLAACRPFCTITGGPGTGKTSTVLALLQVLVALGVAPESIALAAPTGRAAYRLQETLAASPPGSALRRCPPPETLHRLLGYDPTRDRFRHHRNDRLPARVVIVDEASMIDLSLADALCRAVQDEARLVLLGDAHQLPSVDAGAVFRDVVDAGDRPGGWVARLTRSFRVASPGSAGAPLLAAAVAVNAGTVAPLFAGPAARRTVATRARAAEATFSGVELVTGEGDREPLGAFLDHWFKSRIVSSTGFARRARAEYRCEAGVFGETDAADIAWLLAHYGRHRLLTVTRGPAHATGSERVNSTLHRGFLAAMRFVPDGRPAPLFFPGEPVLVTQNDYTRGLFNGDQGVVLRVALRAHEPHHFMAVFPRGDTHMAVPLEALRGSLALGFAMTVHKAQGSEFDEVALILPERPMPILTREIVYTALTRARRGATFVGTRAVLASGVERTASRHSGVARKLMALAPDADLVAEPRGGS